MRRRREEEEEEEVRVVADGGGRVSHHCCSLLLVVDIYMSSLIRLKELLLTTYVVACYLSFMFLVLFSFSVPSAPASLASQNAF